MNTLSPLHIRNIQNLATRDPAASAGLVATACVILWNKTTQLYYYLVFGLFSVVVNFLLRGTLQQFRPTFVDAHGGIDRANLLLTHAHRGFFRAGIPFAAFGMPAAEAQFAGYTAAFIVMYYYFLQKWHTRVVWVFVFLSVYVAGICYTAVHSGANTVAQLAAGFAVGCVTGAAAFYLSSSKIKGVLREKPDDNVGFRQEIVNRC